MVKPYNILNIIIRKVVRMLIVDLRLFCKHKGKEQGDTKLHKKLKAKWYGSLNQFYILFVHKYN